MKAITKKQLENFCYNTWTKRKELGLTQAQFAKKIGVHTQTIYNLESGRSMPSLRVALQICDRLNTPIQQMLV